MQIIVKIRHFVFKFQHVVHDDQRIGRGDFACADEKSKVWIFCASIKIKSNLSVSVGRICSALPKCRSIFAWQILKWCCASKYCGREMSIVVICTCHSRAACAGVGLSNHWRNRFLKYFRLRVREQILQIQSVLRTDVWNMAKPTEAVERV